MKRIKGKHIWVDKGLYSHHGLGLGRGKVIHYSGFSDGVGSGPVCIVSINEFSGGKKVHVEKHVMRKYSPSVSVKRAKSRLHENNYSLVFNNCEHFVNWCIEGECHSTQVDVAVKVLVGALGVPAAPIVVPLAIGYRYYKLFKQSIA